MKTNHKISQDYLEEIKNQTPKIINIGNIKIKTCKNVFPPKSDFSHTSEELSKIFGNLKGMSVLDIGTGTGIQAIQAVMSGADNVVALDINPYAIACAKENAELNNVGGKITIIQSDLFEAVEKNKKFDIIIANLPIADFPIYGIIESALYDPDYQIHKQFFKNVENYLKETGVIIMSHINFKGENDFVEFEKMLLDYGYAQERFIEIQDLGYLWRMYRIKKLTPLIVLKK